MTKKYTKPKPYKNASLRRTFEGIADGDILSIPLGDVNVESLRVRARQLNKEIGRTKYIVSTDRLMHSVRIACV